MCIFAANMGLKKWQNTSTNIKIGPYAIEVGKYRTNEMQVVSGAMGKEKIHYEAVKPKVVKSEMDKFLDWFNNDHQLDLVMKASIAHFWFIIIHPFDDGNGRIGRAITDMLLARAESSGERFYSISMSSQIMLERKRYYVILLSGLNGFFSV